MESVLEQVGFSMKIAVFWGDPHTLPENCDPNTWHSFYNSGWKYGFEKLGHKVDFFAWGDQEDRSGYDLYVYAPGFLTNLTLKPKIYSPNVFFTEEVTLAPAWAIAHSYHYDNVCVLDYMNFKALRALGIRNAWWVPGAVDPTVFRDLNQNRHYNCVFLGTYDNKVFIDKRRTRIDYIQAISQMADPSMVARGYYAFEANKIWNSGKIGIDVPIVEFCSFRLMQMISAGVLCITRETRIDSGIRHLLSFYDTYHNLEELRDEVIPYWVANQDERNDYIRKAQEQVASHHTFEHRAKQLIQIANLEAKDEKLFFCEENL
jgi:hypothetical protein